MADRVIGIVVVGRKASRRRCAGERFAPLPRDSFKAPRALDQLTIRMYIRTILQRL